VTDDDAQIEPAQPPDGPATVDAIRGDACGPLIPSAAADPRAGKVPGG